MQKGFTLLFVILGIVAILAIAGGVYYLGIKNSSRVSTKPFEDTTVCIQDAKQCPDGSWVGRSGLKCEFNPCPSAIPTKSADETANWKTYINKEYKFSFKYPDNPNLKGIVENMFGTMMLCPKCSGWTIDDFSVLSATSVAKSNEEYIAQRPALVDLTEASLNGVNIVEGLRPIAPDMPGVWLVIYMKNPDLDYGYIIQLKYPNLPNTIRLKDLPKPQPDILSTFKFTQ